MLTRMFSRPFLVLLIVLTACAPGPAASATPALPAPRIQIVSPTAPPVPSSIVLPDPSATPALFPMSIEALRQGSYPGSDITTVNELDPGSNYRRFYVYYLSQGLKIYALLTIPNGPMPAGGWPGLVFNHGYIPPAQYRTTERYIAYVDRLAQSGYVVFRIDYRGHDRSEGVAQGAYGDPGYEIDVLNAITSLKNFDQVNPDKIGIWGHSMGGYLTLRAMVISKDIKAGVIWSGVVGSYPDLLYNWHTGPSTPPANAREWRMDWLTRFGPPQENPGFWDSISANSYLADLSGPLQLHYGTGDTEVPPQFSIDLAAQVRAAGRDVQIYSYPGDNHNLSNYFNTAMDRTIAFFDKYLK